MLQFTCMLVSFSWSSADSRLNNSVHLFLQAVASNLLGLTQSRHWSTEGLINLNKLFQQDGKYPSLFINCFSLLGNTISKVRLPAVLQILHLCLLGPMMLLQWNMIAWHKQNRQGFTWCALITNILFEQKIQINITNSLLSLYLLFWILATLKRSQFGFVPLNLFLIPYINMVVVTIFSLVLPLILLSYHKIW